MSEKKLSDVFSDLDLKFIEESDPSLKVKKKPFPIWSLVERWMTKL